MFEFRYDFFSDMDKGVKKTLINHLLSLDEHMLLADPWDIFKRMNWAKAKLELMKDIIDKNEISDAILYKAFKPKPILLTYPIRCKKKIDIYEKYLDKLEKVKMDYKLMSNYFKAIKHAPNRQKKLKLKEDIICYIKNHRLFGEYYYPQAYFGQKEHFYEIAKIFSHSSLSLSLSYKHIYEAYIKSRTIDIYV